MFVRYGAVDIPLGWPLRYAHSPAEVIDTRDLDAFVKDYRGARKELVTPRPISFCFKKQNRESTAVSSRIPRSVQQSRARKNTAAVPRSFVVPAKCGSARPLKRAAARHPDHLFAAEKKTPTRPR